MGTRCDADDCNRSATQSWLATEHGTVELCPWHTADDISSGEGSGGGF